MKSVKKKSQKDLVSTGLAIETYDQPIPENFYKLMNDAEFRLTYCRKSKWAFALYYMGPALDRAFGIPHYQLWNLLERDDWEELIIIGFRELGKTLLAFIDLLHAICYKKCHFAGIVSVDGEKAKNHTYNLAIQLQTNEKIIEDFGQLYHEDESERKQRASKKKTIADFITANGIRVMAFSNRSKFKGEIFIDPNTGVYYRLDYLMFDDIETIASSQSYVISEKTIDAVDEALTSMAPGSRVIYCMNRVSTSMVLAHIESRVNGKNILRYEMPLLMVNGLVADKQNIIEVAKRPGVIAWSERYVATDNQKDIINRTAPSKRQYVDSVETLLHKYGLAVFMRDYMNTPQSDMDVFVKKEDIKNNYYTTVPKPFNVCISIDPQSGMTSKSDEYAITVVAYQKYNPHRYVLEQIAGRGSPIKQAKEFLLLCLKYQEYLVKGGVEVIKTQTAVYQNIIDWMNGEIEIKGLPKCTKAIPIYKSSSKHSKEFRLNSFLPAFERGEIHLPVPNRDENKNMYQLEEQLIFFTNLPHDDRADSLILALELIMQTKGGIYEGEETEYNEDDSTVMGDMTEEKF